MTETRLYSKIGKEIVYTDTVIHFLAMATAVMLWTRYVIVYLGNKKGFGKFLYYAGSLEKYANKGNGEDLQ